MATNNSTNEPTAATGKVLQGQGVGTTSAFSTATYPAVATSTGTILRADGTNWVATTATYPATTTTNRILASSSANVISEIITANNGTLITSASGAPSFLANGTTGQLLTATTGSPPSWASVGTALTTFTPVMAFGGASVGITYSTQTGKYYKIDKMVCFNFQVTLSNKGSSTGQATITGMPFAPNTNAILSGYSDANGGTATTYPTLCTSFNPIIAAGSTTVTLVCNGSATAATNMADTNFSNTSSISISGTYFTT